ncbi:hypothetical protein ACKS0A_01020 [Histoplasma ohiense]
MDTGSQLTRIYQIHVQRVHCSSIAQSREAWFCRCSKIPPLLFQHLRRECQRDHLHVAYLPWRGLRYKRYLEGHGQGVVEGHRERRNSRSRSRHNDSLASPRNPSRRKYV